MRSTDSPLMPPAPACSSWPIAVTDSRSRGTCTRRSGSGSPGRRGNDGMRGTARSSSSEVLDVPEESRWLRGELVAAERLLRGAWQCFRVGFADTLDAPVRDREHDQAQLLLRGEGDLLLSGGGSEIG